MESLHYQE
ncbi:hypothetical protein GWI33_003778, partial [Rhynchophorus ferrugineus]